MQKDLTKDDINALPPMEFNGKIVLIVNPEDVPQMVEKLKTQKVLGFDTETRPSFQKGQDHKVALLQLATEDTAYLVRLKNTAILKEIIPLLTSSEITKVGVAIRDDVKALQRLQDFEPAGFLDIARYLAPSGATPGLRTLAAVFLGVKLSKAAKLTNWSAPQLTQAQLEYAAKDAVAGLQIFLKLQETEKII